MRAEERSNFMPQGYSFIRSDRGEDVSYHVKECPEGIDESLLQPGMHVTYSIATDRRGRSRAASVELTDQAPIAA
jgi:cold shock CspA family protein